MRILPHRRRQERRGLDAILSPTGRGPPSPGWSEEINLTMDILRIERGGTDFMKITGVIVLALSVLLPVGWQPGMTAANDPKTEKVVDASGNLRMPGDYRTAYRFLGSWGVEADQGQGSKEIHVVYASPGTITAYRKNGHFVDGSVLVKEAFEATTGAT